MYAVTLTAPDKVNYVFLGEVISDASFRTSEYRVMYWKEGIGQTGYVELGQASMIFPTVFSIRWTPPIHIEGGRIRMEPVVRKTR